MKSDIRDTALYQEALHIYKTVRQAGTEQFFDANEVQASADGAHAVFTGVLMDKPEGTPATRIVQVDLTSGDMRVLTFGPHADRHPKYAPDGRQIAFLSDRRSPANFQLYLLNLRTGAAQAAPAVNGWVEFLHWSPDGRRILLGVAGNGADLAGAQGGVATKEVAASLPSWMPDVEVGNECYRWRRVWIYELASDQVREIRWGEENVWEAVWCGNDSIAAIVSPKPGEESWYHVDVQLLELASGSIRELYAPDVQLGCLASSPSGQQLAVVEALCSDRMLVAGDLKLIDSQTGAVEGIETNGVDVTYIEWQGEHSMLVAGHRGFESVVGTVTQSKFAELWRSQEITTAGVYLTVSGYGNCGDCVLVGEGFLRSPEIARIQGGTYQAVRSFDLGYAKVADALHMIEPTTWNAPDGLQIQGWLLRTKGSGPAPLVMYVHGGPVWHWRPMWLGRGSAAVLMLLRRGCAVFFPNPRGSSGRGQQFARRVLGDMGGADTLDYLSGIDHLVEQGIADAERLGVVGASYGGFMVSWLISHDTRFSAAVSVAPMINYVTQHLLSNISQFAALFLGDTYTNPSGPYFQRSPLMHAHKVKTPTLNICGGLDRSAPPEEAFQFHRALLENGVTSVLLTYPEEGHGVRRLPATADYAARVVGWFQQHIPTEATREDHTD